MCVCVCVCVCLLKQKKSYLVTCTWHTQRREGFTQKKNQSDLRFGNTSKLATTSMDPKWLSFSIFNKLWLFWGHPKWCKPRKFFIRRGHYVKKEEVHKEKTDLTKFRVFLINFKVCVWLATILPSFVPKWFLLCFWHRNR
jgi:hypothetical protein